MEENERPTLQGVMSKERNSLVPKKRHARRRGALVQMQLGDASCTGVVFLEYAQL